MNQREKSTISKSFKRTAWGFSLATFLSIGGFTVIQNYGAFIYTDLAGIPYQITSACMFLVSILGAALSLVAGATVQNTRSKMGQYRPWIAMGAPVILIGGLIMFIRTGNMMLNAIIITIGYLMPNLILNYSATAEYGIQLKVAGDNSEARNLIASRYWMGSNTGLIVMGMILVPMINFFGQKNTADGYMYSHLVLGLAAICGMLLILRLSKPYDLPNKGEGIEAEETQSLGVMIKGILTNRAGLMLILSDILRCTGFYVLMSMMAYQCEYVIGNPMVMSYFLTATSFMAVIGNSLAPIVAEKLGGRKKVSYFANALTGAFFLIAGFTGKTALGLVIPCCIAYFFMSFQDTVNTMMYADAGEWYLNKTGKDTRTYLMSMFSLAVKTGISFSALALGAVLGIISYEPGMVLTPDKANLMTLATGMIPAVCYLIPVLLLIIHGVSDKEVERCIKENAQKYDSIAE